MEERNIVLQAPKTITKTADKAFFFEIYLQIRTGGRYRATCGVPINPLSVFASVAPIAPTLNDAVCMVRSVEWLDGGFYLTFEVVERTHWLNTGELKPWVGPLDICYAFHGKLR
jgi:hypothetical protein